MKLHPLALVGVLLLTLAAGFGVGVFVQSRHPLLVVNAPELPGLNGNPFPKAESLADARTQAKKKALTEYLDGKEIKDKKTVLAANMKPLSFRKDDIQAIQFSDTAVRSGNEPWSTSVTVLATADGKRYSVHAHVEYREVESTFVIVSFTPTEVSPQ